MLVSLPYLVQEQNKSSDIEQQPPFGNKYTALNKGGGICGYKTNGNRITQGRFVPQYSHLVC